MFNARTKKQDKTKNKKKKKDGRSRRDASPTGTTKTTKTTTAASKWIDPATVAAPATSLSRASGRTRKQVQKFSFIQEPELQLRLLDQLNELCITDIDEFERAVGDITFANDVARDYFDTTLLCGWMGDYGKYAVHITDREERRHPEAETANEDDTGITTDGARRLAKGGAYHGLCLTWLVGE